MRRILLTTGGIILNVLLSYFMFRMNLPLFLDTVGTIAVVAFSGMLFTGIVTAVISSALCSFFFEPALYMAFFNAMIAIIAVWFVKRQSIRKVGMTFLFVLISSLLSALAVSAVQLWLFGQSQQSVVAQNARSVSSVTNIPYFCSFFIISFLLHFLDKGFSCVLVMSAVGLIPAKKLSVFTKGVWMQRPLTEAEIRQIKGWRSDIRHPLQKRTTFTIIITSIMIMVLMAWIGLRLYFDNEKSVRTRNAWNTARAAASLIQADRIEGFIQYGKNADGYYETENMLTRLWLASSRVSHLHVLRIEEGGGRCILTFQLLLKKSLSGIREKLFPMKAALLPICRIFLPEGRFMLPVPLTCLSGLIQPIIL